MMKVSIYESLSALNRGMEQFLENLQVLKESGIIASEFADRSRLAAEQIRAEINHRTALSLTETEQQDAARFEKLRRGH